MSNKARIHWLRSKKDADMQINKNERKYVSVCMYTYVHDKEKKRIK